MLVDTIVLVISYFLAWMIRFVGPMAATAVRTRSFQQYMMMLILIIPVYLLLYQAFTLYTPMRMQGRRLVLANIIKANSLGLLILMFTFYMVNEGDYSRSTYIMFYVINIILQWCTRMLIFTLLRDMREKGLNQKQMICVGYSRAAEEYIDRVLANPQWGYVIRGILDDNVPAGTEYRGIKVLGRIANLNIILPENRLDEIAITLGLSEYYRLEEIVALCEKSGVHTKFIPDYNKIIPTKPYTEDILGLPVINIRYVPLNNTFNALIKRAMDIVGSIVGIIVTSPLMILMCLIIKLTSPGPLIYKQERVGLHNQTFWMYKFRSMEVQPEAEEKKAWTVKNDPFAREMLAAGGKMILGSDSHTRYGALGTMAMGEGGPELVKHLLSQTYDINMPGVVAIYLTGSPRPGVGPQDVALAIIGKVFANGYVKNKVMEFVGPGVANLSADFRIGVDVMTRQEAIRYLEELTGQASLRETTLEDVFVERAGKHLISN